MARQSSRGKSNRKAQPQKPRGPLSRISLSIDSLAAGGDGVGRDKNGRVTFVVGGAPGDEALVELFQERKQFARGRIVELVKASPQRVDAPCDYFKSESCGGCQWQHLGKAEQTAAKTEIVSASLRAFIEGGMKLRPMLSPVQPYHWRRRARLSYWVQGEVSVLGFFPSRSNRVQDITRCEQLSSRLNKALLLLRETLLPGLQGRGEVELLEGVRGVHVAIHGKADKEIVEKFADAKGIAGVVWGRRILGSSMVKLPEGTRASAAGFAQGSELGNRSLKEVVSEALGSLVGKSCLELYAGNGNLTQLLGEAAEVVAVELETVEADSGNTHWIEGDAAAVSGVLAQDGQRFDLVLLDPPRQGAKDAIDSIAKIAQEHVVYVSCDSATLARDSKSLVEAGFVPKWAQPIDMMPQTSQVEVVMVFSRS